MTQAKFLLEFLVVPFDPPAEFGAIDQCLEADIGRQGGQPVLGRLVLVCGSFNHQPLLGRLLRPRDRADTPAGKA